MVDSGVVERWEVSDQVREALEWLTDATARVVTDNDHRTGEIDQPLRQRRRGRDQPIEQSPEAEKPPEVIVVTAEAVPIDAANNPETLAEAVIVEENPGSEPD